MSNFDKPTAQALKSTVPASSTAQQSDNIAHALAGAGGGLLSMTLTYPLITLSTRAQVESKRAHSSTLDAARRIVQREGITGLYAGLDSALFGITVTNFVYYYWYEWTRAGFERAAFKAGRATKRLTTIESMIAGALAGSATVLITNPIWVVNTRMTARKAESTEADNPKKAPSTIGTLLALLREEGPAALFAGVLPALVLVINPILQYTIFEQLKNTVEKRRRVMPRDAFFLGAFGKLLATSITYPYITVKSRMHVASKEAPKDNIIQSLNRIIREEGWAGLYKGIGPKVTQSVITAAFLFAFKDALYEMTIQARRKMQARLLTKGLELAVMRSTGEVIDLTIEDDSDEVVSWQPARATKRLAPLSATLHRNPSQRAVLSNSHQHQSRKVCLKRRAGQSSTNALHESERKRNTSVRILETPGPNDLGTRTLPMQVPRAETVKNTLYGTEPKRSLPGPSESHFQGSFDLSQVGPGEYTRPRKRTADGRLKAPVSSRRTSERSHNLVGSDGWISAQPGSEAEPESEDTGAIQFQAGTESRGSATAIKAVPPKKSSNKSFRKKPPLTNAQGVRHQSPSHRSPPSLPADETISRSRTLLAPQRTYSTSQPSTSSLLRLRELGHGGKSSWLDTYAASSQLRSRRFNSLKPWRTWTGASNDVMVLAWSPEGESYAVGASAQTDESSMMYNRPNNLLYGSLPKNTLWELPDHRIDRPIPATGPSSNPRTYNACDPYLYMSVTSVCFSASGNYMYSASYDETVKVWDTSSEGRLLCSNTLVHDAQVEVMALSGHGNEHLATGSRLVNDAIRIYQLSNYGSVLGHSTLSSLKAQATPALEIYPSCLQWGLSPFSQHLLLAGFSESKDQDNSHDPGKVGDLCLWDLITEKPMEVIPRAQNVFDIAWHQTLPVFAVGTVLRVGHISDKSCRSAVRIYEPFRMSGSSVEFECPALDINDVSFCPTDSHYITAGCTDGVTYVWDYRNPGTVVHQLEHGLPIAPMKPDMTREQSDTGIRLTAWADLGSQFYTGSSDGIIKRWNIKLAPEDVHIQDVAQFEAGIMCGAFSPDSTNLLVGDAQGSVHILSTAPIVPRDSDLDDVKAIRFHHARGNNGVSEGCDAATQENDSPSANAARALVTSDEIVIHPLWGAGQGPKYRGPYASYAREEGADPTTDPLLPKYQVQQLDSGQRALAAKAGIVAEPAERKLIAMQHELARARNLKVVKEDLFPKKFPIRLSPEKKNKKPPKFHSPSTQQRHQGKQSIYKSTSQLSSKSETRQFVQSSTIHTKNSKGQQAFTSQVSTVSATHSMMQLSEKHKTTGRQTIVISSDEDSDSDQNSAGDNASEDN